MNSLYTLGVRQTNSIQADLERLRTGDASASLLGLSLILIPSHPPPVASLEFLDGLRLRPPRVVVRAMAGLDMDRLLTAYRSAFLFVFG